MFFVKKKNLNTYSNEPLIQNVMLTLIQQIDGKTCQDVDECLLHPGMYEI